MKRLLILIPPLALLGALAAGYLLFTGPRMYEQPHIRACQADMPPTPDGAVPVKNPVATMPTTQEAGRIVRALPADAGALAAGKTYYGYYCVACHGDAGDGRGPVGGSLHPSPADLRSPRVQSMSDGELFRAMLTGPTHSYALPRAVYPEHRPYLVLYVRQFATTRPVSK